MQNPVGIDVEQPSLSWEINANARGVKQTGYRVLVASSLEKLNADEGDIWDSGWVRSEQSTNVLYQGQPPIAEYLLLEGENTRQPGG